MFANAQQLLTRRRVFVIALFAILAVLLLTAATTQAAPTQANGTYHWVQRGETLSSISRHYGVPVAAIMRANPQLRNPNLIFAGTRIWIPGSWSGGPGTGGPCRAVHHVMFGQTLSQIARWYHTTPGAIAHANGIWNWDRIYAGQSLCIP